MRPEEHLEASRAGRLGRARGVDADDVLARAERRMAIGLRPDRRLQEDELPGPGSTVARSPARTSAAEPCARSALSSPFVRDACARRRRRGGSRAAASWISSESAVRRWLEERKRRVGEGGTSSSVSGERSTPESVVRAYSIRGTLSAMRFRKDAKLDRSQVEDIRGRRVGGAPMALGGGGIVTLIIIVAIALLGGNPLDTGGGASPFDDLAGQTAGNGPPSSTLEHCQTGQDANEHQDCRILAVVNSVQKHWSSAFRGYEPARTTLLHRRSVDRLRPGELRSRARSTARRTGNVYIDLGFFEQLQSQLRRLRRAHSPRRTSSRTSTGTTSRI